jgi:hypothetical protein
VKPVAAIRTVGTAITDKGVRENIPSSLRSSSSTEPNNVATPMMCTRLMMA